MIYIWNGLCDVYHVASLIETFSLWENLAEESTLRGLARSVTDVIEVYSHPS